MGACIATHGGGGGHSTSSSTLEAGIRQNSYPGQGKSLRFENLTFYVMYISTNYDIYRRVEKVSTSEIAASARTTKGAPEIP
jgi:hypothetical protein